MRHKNVPAHRHLMRSAAGFALSLGLTAAAANIAYAQTTINTDTTEPLATSAAGDITIADVDTVNNTLAGSITLTDEVGPAITLDSDNAVINNGAIVINGSQDDGSPFAQGVDGATAVELQGGPNRSFTQGGSIIINDNLVLANTDDDVLADGPIAQGTGRTGILISGASPFEGNVELQASSNLQVAGNDSFGINLDNTAMTQGGLTGNLLTDGNINLTGSDGAAINVAADISGDINNSGSIGVIGENSNGINVASNVGGGFINSGTITNTGFRSNTRPATVDGITGRDIFVAEDLLNAGSSINISGDIARGVFLEQRLVPVLDVDGEPVEVDGVVEMQIASISSIQQFGSAPAIAIDGNGVPIALGTVAAITDPNDPDFSAAQQFAFVNQGALTASGVFDDFDATVFSVADATLEGGINNQGTLNASTFVAPVDLEDPTRGSGIARVIVLGDQAIADSINNSGIIQASASEAADVVFADIDNPIAPRDVTAISIDIGENASASSLINSGAITSIIIGRQGEAVAIRDSSGTLTSLTNTGTIIAAGQNSDPTGASLTNFDAIAVDLSNNTTGVAFNQFDNGSVSPALLLTSGDVLLGSGDDTLTSTAGSFVSDIDFAGGNDTLSLSGTNVLGNISNTDGLILSAAQGSNLTFTEATPVNLTSATFDGSSSFNPVLDVANGTASTLIATGDINFDSGASITPVISNLDFTDAALQDGVSFDIADAGGDLTIGDLMSLASPMLLTRPIIKSYQKLARPRGSLFSQVLTAQQAPLAPIWIRHAARKTNLAALGSSILPISQIASLQDNLNNSAATALGLQAVLTPLLGHSMPLA